jgi:hypothetical protein
MRATSPTRFQYGASCARVLRPNGKLCINAMAMPIPQSAYPQDTRHIENIPADFYCAIVGATDLHFYDEYVWLKQGTKGMFGSWPNPGNILSNSDRAHHDFRQGRQDTEIQRFIRGHHPPHGLLQVAQFGHRELVGGLHLGRKALQRRSLWLYQRA